MKLVENKRPVEGELMLDFSSAENVWNFDESGEHKMSHCMKAVDYIVEWPDEVWLVEVKDPAKTTIPAQYRQQRLDEFMERIRSDRLFSRELGPKCKDSFLFLHLNGNILNKPLKYLVLLGVDSIDSAMMIRCAENLKRATCFLGPDSTSWTNSYLETTRIFNLAAWNRIFIDCPVTRIAG